MTCAGNTKATTAFNAMPSSHAANDAPGRGWFRPFFQALARSRKQAARREIQRYAHLVAAAFAEAAFEPAGSAQAG